MNLVFQKKLIAVLAIGLLLGGFLGYGYGFAKGVNYTVTMGYNFLKSSGVDFSLSADQIADLIQAYQTQFETPQGSQSTIGEYIVNEM